MPPRPPDRPDGFPDMTIPDRPALDRTDTTVDRARPLFPTSQVAWKVGDRVLAPWEPNFLYVGKIAQLDGGQALIEFEDGDAGWVQLDQIRTLALARHLKVLCRQRMGPTFAPAEILDIDGDKVHVRFQNGSDEWTRLAALRIPCEPRGPGAAPAKVASHLAFLQHLRRGDRVWAPWGSTTLFAGTVDDIRDQEAHIHFDDGDQGWVLLEQLVPLQLVPGTRVLGRWKMGAQYHPAIVTQMDGERVHLRYDNGDQETTRAVAVVVPCEPIGPAARPSKVVNRGRVSWRWLVALAVIGAVVLFFLLRSGR
jgi:hypothetical protein